MPRPPFVPVRVAPMPPGYMELEPLPAYPQENPPSYEDSQAGKHVTRAVRVVDAESGEVRIEHSLQRSCQWKCCQAMLIMMATFGAFVSFTSPASAIGIGFAVGTVFALLGACVCLIASYTAHQRRRDQL